MVQVASETTAAAAYRSLWMNILVDQPAAISFHTPIKGYKMVISTMILETGAENNLYSQHA
jgi:hypothetical protein